MRTTFLRFFIISALMLFASIQMQALTINYMYSVTSNQIINDNVYIVTGGTLSISTGCILTIGSGYHVYLNNGSIILNNNAILNFSNAGQLIINSGTISCNNATITGNAAMINTSIEINNGNVLSGICSIENMNIHINVTTWSIPAGSNITLSSHTTISDPASTNTNYISVAGTLGFTGNSYINTNPADRITQISILAGGTLTASNANIYALPDINAAYPSDITSTNSDWYFESYKHINSQGDITMSTTDLSAYNLDEGWNGIYFHDTDYGELNLSYCRINTINTITHNYAIAIERAGGYNHTIANCTFYAPTQYYSGNAIQIIGTSVASASAYISCTYVQDFNNGLYQNGTTHSDILNSEFAYNDVGLLFNQVDHAELNGSSIHENNDIGIIYIATTSTGIHESEIYNNGNYEIYIDADPTGMLTSHVDGNTNNIYNTTGTNLYLVGVYNASTAVLVETWWNAYPPQIAVDFDVVNSTMIFNAWQYNPYSITGYTTCGMVYPKHTRRDPSAQPIASGIDIHNYPNPFNPSTQIVYTLPEDMSVFLSVYSLDGKLIQTLSEGFQSQGTHTITFNAPATMASGMYMYVLNTPIGVKNGMMLLTK